MPISLLPEEEDNSSKNSLKRLIDGNDRYITSTSVYHDDWTAKRTALLRNQSPFAIIIGCSDSRVPPEIIFDQSLGALFVIRVAGNVVDDYALGSIEYAVSVLGANLIIVLGHQNCGAVDSALRGLKFDNHIQKVLNAIDPAIQSTKDEKENILEKTVKANVKHVQEKLKNSKPTLLSLVEEGKLEIKGAYYHFETGKVEILDNG